MIRAFLSFVEEDLNLVNLFRGQAKNAGSDLEFADYSLKQPYNSSNADYIKAGITAKIQPTNLTICLCGRTTYTSDWVTWELNKSLELGKPIMGVYLRDDVQYYPGPLKQWPMVNWDIPQIVATMRRLTR